MTCQRRTDKREKSPLFFFFFFKSFSPSTFFLCVRVYALVVLSSLLSICRVFFSSMLRRGTSRGARKTLTAREDCARCSYYTTEMLMWLCTENGKSRMLLCVCVGWVGWQTSHWSSFKDSSSAAQIFFLFYMDVHTVQLDIVYCIRCICMYKYSEEYRAHSPAPRALCKPPSAPLSIIRSRLFSSIFNCAQ